MTELENVLNQWKPFLEEAGYEEAGYLDTIPTEELSDLLRKFKREIKRRESAYSPSSEKISLFIRIRYVRI